MNGFSWVCPYCGHAATIGDEDMCSYDSILYIKNTDGYRCLTSIFIVCPNAKCRRFTLTATLKQLESVFRPNGSGRPDYSGRPILREWSLIPESKAKSFPDYIPKPILDDYGEACLIRDLSPKASATLSRRCLQGIIRDFWRGKVKPGRLAKEIEQLEGLVDDDTWQAIDGVRSVGNIGAHMEEDINVIVDVEPHEAQLLVELIEILLKDWYVAREQKRLHLEAIRKLSAEKESARKVKKGKCSDS
jgi:hypothetical protein